MLTLARKLAIHTTALIVAAALLGGASLWGLMALSGHFTAAGDQYEQLRAVYQAGHHAATARLLMQTAPHDTAAVADQLSAARTIIEQLRLDPTARTYGPSIVDVAAKLDEASRGLGAGQSVEPRIAAVNAALLRVADLAGEIRRRIIANRQAAADQLRVTIGVMIGLTAGIVVAATTIGVRQYRGVMNPLRRLEQAVAHVADADFAQRIPVAGEAEFRRLAEQFNRMADQLDTLYHDLAEQVETRSRQLVRSERLAGVGYLAAGLAHEINNPLGIIGGYAEAALAKLDLPGDAAASLDHARRALTVVAEEAFRCKAITGKLLSLSRPGDEGRAVIDLAAVAGRVVDLMRGLKQFADRSLSMDAPHGAPIEVQANEGELTQVLINLVVNALAAVEPGGGRVTVSVRRQGGWATATVSDNGRGIDPSLLGRVFEPFFTDSPRRDERGTGLGLSVAHAIVERHGGRLRAESEGVGRGCRFIVELPAWKGGGDG